MLGTHYCSAEHFFMAKKRHARYGHIPNHTFVAAGTAEENCHEEDKHLAAISLFLQV
jgi:hypothetical protein